MIIREINAQTGQITEREMTAEELAQMEAIEEQPIQVPQSITSRQLRLQWVLSGYSISDIENAIEQLPDPHKEIAKINWEYAGTFERQNELLINVATSLDITEEQLNQIFTDASSL